MDLVPKRPLIQCRFWDCRRLQTPYCSLNHENLSASEEVIQRAVVVVDGVDMDEQERISHKVLMARRDLFHCGAPILPSHVLHNNPWEMEQFDMNRMEQETNRDWFFISDRIRPGNIWHLYDTKNVAGNELERSRFNMRPQPEEGCYKLHQYSLATDVLNRSVFWINFTEHGLGKKKGKRAATVLNDKEPEVGIDLLNPSAELGKKKHELKRLDVKCQDSFNNTTVFSHSQAVVVCGNCQTVLYQPTGGMDAIKLEGGSPSRITAAKSIVEAGIAVMGHVGLTPQTISVLGGFRPQGRNIASAVKVVETAMALQEAGCFSVVLECVPPPVAAAATSALHIPTIDIGAGPFCSGQVLVYHDLLGMMQHPHHAKVTPKFCKQYAQVGEVINKALLEYKEEVTKKSFPGPSHSPYKSSTNQAVDTAVRVLKGGMDAIKLEGGSPSRITAAKSIVEAGITVMGHVGLTPQAISVLDGFRPQGRNIASAVKVVETAMALQEAGCFSVVLECVSPPVAAAATSALHIPTIGIEAGPFCSGQVLQNDIDLFNPSAELGKRKHELKRLDVKCQNSFNNTTVFSHSQTVVVCGNCQTVLYQPTEGMARLLK